MAKLSENKRSITSIDYEAIVAFDKWRAEEMGREPHASTINTHNAALSRIFQTALKRGFINQMQVPKLINKKRDSTLAEAWADRHKGENIWQNPSVKFLDPCVKSGVFLREIAARLISGLAADIPDLQRRVDHILTKQLFGIAVTRLTSLLARRSVYCSKFADSEHSVAKGFHNGDGNIWFQRSNHSWLNDKCTYCGSSKDILDRGIDIENHAYKFIHSDDARSLIPSIFGESMQFDVIIGNPPYQMSTGGAGRQAKPVYNLFIEQAINLNPKFLVMVTPSRWFGGGMGLGAFRELMLNSKKISKLTDYTDSREVFGSSVDISGGVSFFVWDREHFGDCEVTANHSGNVETSMRDLSEFPTFIRQHKARDIVAQVVKRGETSITSIVSGMRPFGLATTARPSGRGDYILISSGGTGRIESSEVTRGHEYLDKWIVITSKASHDHGGQPDKEGRRRVFSRLEVHPPGCVCTESYIVMGAFSVEADAQNYKAYLSTKFVRFLTAQLSFSQDITRERFSFVPMQDFTKRWTDELLYAKYKLEADQISYINSMIRPMELGDE
ncbi:restriction endonuclease [Chakrabartia godavariana]|nr:restriction endonuclease [Chakrabartia godavariana]